MFASDANASLTPIDGEFERLSATYPSKIATVFRQPDQDRVVVALFAGEKASMGDVFYDSVGMRADPVIEGWIVTALTEIPQFCSADSSGRGYT